MFYINALPPVDKSINEFNYTRFGVVISKEEIKIESLKDLFPDSPLSEEKLEAALRSDSRIFIENDNDREARENKEAIVQEALPETKLEKDAVKRAKKDALQKEIEEFNEEKQAAQKTETKEDDKIVAEKEKGLMEKIKEVNDELE